MRPHVRANKNEVWSTTIRWRTNGILPRPGGGSPHATVNLLQSAGHAAPTELGSRLAALYANQRRSLLFIRAAGTWRYGEMIEATDIARGAGAQVIGYMPSKQ